MRALKSTILSFPLVLIACGSQSTMEQAGDADGSVDSDADNIERSNPFGDGSGCPSLQEGLNTITVNGQSRSFTIVLPDEPKGAPLVYAWHWLGGTASQTLNFMGLATLADKGAIVVAPTSSGLSFEWDFLAPSDSSVDIALFDALQLCVWESWQVDTNRVYSTGMSAGGLFTSYLSLYRSEQLAAALPFSGGVPDSYYNTPSDSLPVMIVWGGAGDQYGSFDFHGSSLAFSQSLRSDGHFVVECMHGGAHTPPAEAASMAWTFFEAHSKSETTEPWAGGIPDSLPSYCRIP